MRRIRVLVLGAMIGIVGCDSKQAVQPTARPTPKSTGSLEPAWPSTPKDQGEFVQETEDAVADRLQKLGMPADRVVCAGMKPAVNVEQPCQVRFGQWQYTLQFTLLSITQPARDIHRISFSSRWARGSMVRSEALVKLFSIKLSGQLGLPVTVTCGTEPLLVVENRQARCTMTTANATSGLTVTFDEQQNITHYNLTPGVITRGDLENVASRVAKHSLASTARVDCGSGSRSRWTLPGR